MAWERFETAGLRRAPHRCGLIGFGDLAAQGIQVAVIFDDARGEGAGALGVRGGGEALSGGSFVQTAFAQAVEDGVKGGDDEPDFVEGIFPACFEEKRGFDDNGGSALLLRPGGSVLDETAREGPHDGGESRQELRVTEDTGAQSYAVYGAVLADNLGSESADEGVEAVGAGRVRLVRHAVRVDDGGAELCEIPPDLALTARDAAGESNLDHEGKLSV